MTRALLSVFLLSLILANPAQAYLDPGTGSMILQALAAGAVAVAIFWRSLLSKVKRLFGKGGAPGVKNEDQQPPPTNES